MPGPVDATEVDPAAAALSLPGDAIPVPAPNPEIGPPAASPEPALPVAARPTAPAAPVLDAPALPAIAPVPAQDHEAGEPTLLTPDSPVAPGTGRGRGAASASTAVPAITPLPASSAAPVAAPAPPPTPITGKSDGLSADADAKPALLAEAKPRPQSKLPIEEVGNVKHTPPTAAPPVGKSALEPAQVETDKAPPPEHKATADKPVDKVESPRTSAPTKRAGPQVEPRLPTTNPVGADTRAPDIRIMPALDLGTAAIQSAPSSQSMVTPAALAAPAAPAAASAPAPMVGLAVAIATNAQNGRNRFDIRLDPPELGRIDVRLHFDSSGNVTSHLIVDRSETLDLLRRDAADLERSLQQAGLKTSDSGLQFSLRDRSQGFDHENNPRGPATHFIVADPEPAIDPMVRGYLRAGQGAGLDIRV